MTRSPSRVRRPAVLAAAVASAGALLLSGLAVPAQAAEEPTPPDRTPSLRSLALVPRLVDDARAVGVVTEVQRGRTHWASSAGRAAKGRPAAPAPDARFRAGSVTKQLVAVLVLQEVEAGRVTLDSTLGELLPGVWPGRESTTLRQLLSHTSGIPDYVSSYLISAASNRAFVEAISTRATDPELVALAQQQPVVAQPGAYDYSNTNYVLLGMVLERLTGSSMGDLVRERILEPANMTRSVLPTGRAIQAPRMKEYLLVGKRRIDLSTFQPSTFSSAGALVSTAGDLNRFQEALDRGRLLDRRLVRQMRTPVTTDPETGFAYGLGSYVLPGIRCAGRPIVGHDGATWGTYTLNFSSGSKRLTLAVTGRDVTPKRLGDQSRLMIRFVSRTFDEICRTSGNHDKSMRAERPRMLVDAQASLR